ncbi:hypothetical protein ACLB1E_12705 [Escherichia coli]
MSARSPLVTTGGAGGQIDPTQIQVTDLAKTIQDPLAAKLRERLKGDWRSKNSKGKLGVDCVFSTKRWCTRSQTVRCVR